jgi:hypothetical protein
MEVHQHTHTPRKKWIHYLWEFLMLFLAVFCGFLAENQREHIVEHQREKKYMLSLMEDLKADTFFINDEIITKRQITIGLDSLIRNLYSKDIFSKQAEIYRQFRRNNPILTPLFNDQTIFQLRSSGNMRLIRNDSVVKLISEYWNAKNALIKIAERVEQRIDFGSTYNIKIFNRKYTEREYQNQDFEGAEMSIDPNAKLMTSDIREIEEYANIMVKVSASIKIYIERLKGMRKDAVKLLDYVKQEYNLK